jgi:hypothetical protein
MSPVPHLHPQADLLDHSTPASTATDFSLISGLDPDAAAKKLPALSASALSDINALCVVEGVPIPIRRDSLENGKMDLESKSVALLYQAPARMREEGQLLSYNDINVPNEVFAESATTSSKDFSAPAAADMSTLGRKKL